MGWVYYYARRWDQARYHLGRAIAMNPMAEESYRILGFTLAAQGQLEEAERVLREAVGLPGSVTYAKAALGYVLALAGKRDEALALIRDLEEMATQGYVSPVAFGYIYLGLGDVDHALHWIERAHEERRGWMAYLKVTPILDGVRGNPRFEALVKEMKLD
jgi:eukaryotic-like serine/threonine-protein kinase